MDQFVFSLQSSLVRSWTPTRLLIFLLVALVGCSAGGEVEKLREENEQLRQKLEAAREEATSLQRGETIEVLSTDVYFKSGSAELTSTGVDELKAVAQRIQEEFPDRTIRIEGYTDSQPIGERLETKYPSNWELSAARATTVVRHLISESGLDPTQFIAVSYGATDPVASNETARGRRRNRRVRIAVLPSPRDYSRPFETAW